MAPSIAPGCAPFSTVTSTRRAAAVIERFKLAEAVGPVRTPTMPGADMWARWCVPVRQDDRLLGFLWVLDPDGTVAEADLPALVECAELAAEVMVEAQQAVEDRTRRRDDLVDRLLETRDPEAARALARLQGLPPDTRVQVQAPGIRGRLAAAQRDECARGGHPGTGLAISGTPLPLADLGEAFRRAVAARRAIAAGARVDPPSWDGLGAWRLIVEAPESLSPSHIHPGAAVLAQQSNAALMATARVILDLRRRRRRCRQGVAPSSHHPLLPDGSHPGTDRR